MKKTLLAGLVLACFVAAGNAAADENPILGKWRAIQPKHESTRIAKTLLGDIEFLPDSLVTPHGTSKVTYRVADAHTVFVKVPTGPKDAPGEKIGIKDGRLQREISWIDGGVLEYRRIR